MNQHEQLIQALYEQMAALKRSMMHSRDQLMGQLQLTRTQIEVLMLLADKESQTVGDLAGLLGVTHSAATQTIETLVKRDLVDRLPDESDRRVVRSRLSVAGRELADRLHVSRMKSMNQIFADLSPGELELMTKVLKQLSHQFDEMKLQGDNQ